MTASRDAYLKRKYGISSQQFIRLQRRQKQACPVCTRPFVEMTQTPHVDHDHKTGEIRGVLCGHCNHRVIGRHRDPELLRRAGAYLDGPFTGWFVPKKVKKTKKVRRKGQHNVKTRRR